MLGGMRWVRRVVVAERHGHSATRIRWLAVTIAILLVVLLTVLVTPSLGRQRVLRGAERHVITTSDALGHPVTLTWRRETTTLVMGQRRQIDVSWVTDGTATDEVSKAALTLTRSRARELIGDSSEAQSGPTSVVFTSHYPVGLVINHLAVFAGLVAAILVLAVPIGVLIGRGTPVVMWRRYHKRCVSCGYPLKGLPTSVCPECGREDNRLSRSAS